MDAINHVLWSYKENSEQLSDPDLQDTVSYLQRDDATGRVRNAASLMARLIIHIPAAANIVDEHHCGTPLHFIQAMGTKLQALAGPILEKQIDHLATKHRTASFDVPETVAGVFVLSLARLFGFIDHFDIPDDFAARTAAVLHDPVVRDYMLAANTARLCVSRLVRTRCAAHPKERRTASKEASVDIARKRKAADDAAGKGNAADDAARKGKAADDAAGKDRAADDAAGKDKDADSCVNMLTRWNNADNSAGKLDEAPNPATGGGEGSDGPPRKRQNIEILSSDSEDDGAESTEHFMGAFY